MTRKGYSPGVLADLVLDLGASATVHEVHQVNTNILRIEAAAPLKALFFKPQHVLTEGVGSNGKKQWKSKSKILPWNEKKKFRPAKRPCAFRKGSLISKLARVSPKGPQT
eukprot:822529-Pelagomonas_calceolata.AAC.2